MGRRIDVEADYVFEFLSELRIIRELERADAMGGRAGGLQGCVAPIASSLLPPSPASGPSNGLLPPAAARAPGRRRVARWPLATAACRACASCRAQALPRLRPCIAPANATPPVSPCRIAACSRLSRSRRLSLG